jgi:hypothetical protein
MEMVRMSRDMRLKKDVELSQAVYLNLNDAENLHKINSLGGLFKGL